MSRRRLRLLTVGFGGAGGVAGSERAILSLGSKSGVDTNGSLFSRQKGATDEHGSNTDKKRRRSLLYCLPRLQSSSVFDPCPSVALFCLLCVLCDSVVSSFSGWSRTRDG